MENFERPLAGLSQSPREARGGAPEAGALPETHRREAIRKSITLDTLLSFAPAPSPFGPTFGCSTSRLPRRSVVVKPSGSAFKNPDFHFPGERLIWRHER